MGEQRREFWKKHPGLVWSNPDASDSVHIRAALLRPRFDRVLEIAVEFGLERLRREWSVLEEENSPDFIRAREPVQRILKNLEKGFASVAAGTERVWTFLKDQPALENQLDIALARLCSGTPQANDEGYAHLLSNPPLLNEMRDYFIAQRDGLEVLSATEAARRKKDAK